MLENALSYLGGGTARTGMKGEFSRATFSARMRYGSVSLQEGRVQLDTDWNEKSELQINGGLVYLDVWERDLRSTQDSALGKAASGGPNVSSVQREQAAESYGLRLVRDVTVGGSVSSTLHAALGRATGKRGESFLLPELEVSVEGVVWRKVDSLSGCGPSAQVYTLTEEGDLTCITFGDGKQGARLDVGSRIVASYRFEGGGVVPKAVGGSARTKPRAK